MAIYHLSMKIISRKNGYSAVASAAYRSGSVIPDDRTGLTHDYTRKRGVDDAVILTPENAPSWCADRSVLWNAVEKAEQRRDSQLAREIELAIPREISRDVARETVLAFVRENFVSQGMIADVAFHHMDRTNPHAHIMLTTRAVGETGFSGKVRDWNDRTLAETWRASWADHANRALANAGYLEEIDHRSYERQGLEKAPGLHLGKAACAMEKRGMETERGEQNRLINSLNLEIQVSRTQLALRKVQETQRKRELSDAARRAAEALNLTIPAANASADTLREFIATLPQECGNAWEMTPEFVAMNGKANDIKREGNALVKERDILEKEMTGLRKAHPVASILSELPLMTWAEPEYRKRQLRFWKLEKQIESLRRTYRAVKERDIPARRQAFETQWNTWISPGMAELKEKLSAREAERHREEAEAEARRKEQEYDARLKHHDNHRLSRETALAGVITGLGRAREPGTGMITRYMILSNRAGEFTVWGDELADYPQSVYDQVNVYLSPGGAVMVTDIHSGLSESHETLARPERVRMYSGATVRHVLEQMRQGWPSYGFPALPHHWPDNFYFSDDRRPTASPLPSAHRVDVTAYAAPEQLMPVVFSTERNSRTLNLLLCKGPEEMLVGFVRLEDELRPVLALPSPDYSHLMVSIITENGIHLAGYGEAINRDADTPYPPEPKLMQFRLKGCQDTLFAAINKPEEMPDYLFRQLGFNQTWHEWKRDEQHRQQQRRPGHYRGMSM
ncbi:MobA/MobL family protein [Escherichia coli]|uniref:MobQ family relaxase n=3 Tax=Escherichia coli TaxID=562 RepID=UPI00107B45FB|nr:MobQ family relaxase [Escherichia coli]EFQ8415346.1 MobA/MobL family protein [Shigella sonnei]EFV7847624.1 conjugal transfer protein [Shigella flexneri]HDQ6987835.1 MobA/MobL family protein [Escherichia coli O113:H21]EEC8530837.1 MobA/MobL family protein [Escherichia coli]EEQ3144788.1 MobA/MobL family protein [Escherichia coli]